jgi:hypothetical protein
MASISDLNKRRRLEGERDEFRRAILKEDDPKERRALQRALEKIELELKNCDPVFPEVPELPQTPALPDSHYREPLPSERIRFKSSLKEGMSKSQK